MLLRTLSRSRRLYNSVVRDQRMSAYRGPLTPTAGRCATFTTQNKMDIIWAVAMPTAKPLYWKNTKYAVPASRMLHAHGGTWHQTRTILSIFMNGAKVPMQLSILGTWPKPPPHQVALQNSTVLTHYFKEFITTSAHFGFGALSLGHLHAITHVAPVLKGLMSIFITCICYPALTVLHYDCSTRLYQPVVAWFV